MVLARTVADGCARERNVERTHPQPPDPQSETGTLATHSGKKLLVDVTNLAPCCHDDYDVLLEVLGTLGKCYVSNPVAKTLLKTMTGTTVFACLPGTHPHWTQKSFKTNSFT